MTTPNNNSEYVRLSRKIDAVGRQLSDVHGLVRDLRDQFGDLTECADAIYDAVSYSPSYRESHGDFLNDVDE